MKAGGFTTFELLIVIAFFGIALAVVTLPLATLQTRTALGDAVSQVKDEIRRAETQSLSGYLGTGWGVHLSGSTTGCVFPATQFYVFRGDSFDSASDTTSVVDLPDTTSISGVSIGGGCDIKFTRFHGATTNTGTVTIQNTLGATGTVTINAKGRIIQD